MRFVSTRAAGAPGVSLRTAMLEGLAPDGGLYVPEAIEPWQPGELSRLRNRTLTEIAYRALRPYTRGELDAAICEAVVVNALNFPIPLVEVEPGIYALELFHGPTLAFKDVGARTMARLMASLDTGDQPLTVLAATSGDTGSAVAHAFHGVPHTRVVDPLSRGPRQSDSGSAADDVQLRERQRARLCRVRELRRLPPAHEGGVRERRPPRGRCA